MNWKLWKTRISAAQDSNCGLLPHCGDHNCTALRRTWRRLRWRKARIRLEQSWYCAPQCFERATEQRFLQLCASPAPRPPVRHRIPLGLLMLSRGQLTNHQLRSALEAQRSNGRERIGQWLEKLGFATEQQITAALGLQWACPVLASASVSDAAARMLPFPLLEQFRMLPVQFVASRRLFHLAFCEGVDYAALYAVEQMLDCRTQACLVSRSVMDQELAQIGQDRRPADFRFESWRDVADMARITCGYVLELGAESVRIVGCGEYIWARLEAGPDQANLLFRRTAPVADPQRFPLPQQSAG